jgi:hypothetical protein
MCVCVCACTGKMRPYIAELKLNYIWNKIMLNAKIHCSKHKSSVESRRVVRKINEFVNKNLFILPKSNSALSKSK